MYSTSSRMQQRANADGSLNVYCFRCNEFIAKTLMAMPRALCELCRRVENGEVLTEEAIRQYKMGKLGRQDVSMLLMADAEAQDKKFTMRTMVGDILQTVGFKKKVRKVPKSVEVSKSKRRTRLFAGVNIGNIQEERK